MIPWKWMNSKIYAFNYNIKVPSYFPGNYGKINGNLLCSVKLLHYIYNILFRPNSVDYTDETYRNTHSKKLFNISSFRDNWSKIRKVSSFE